jgi:hypothetical protein
MVPGQGRGIAVEGMTIGELWTSIQAGGVPFLLFLILVTGFRGMWVWGYLYRQERAEKEEWKRMALDGTSLARVATRKAEAETGGTT